MREVNLCVYVKTREKLYYVAADGWYCAGFSERAVNYNAAYLNYIWGLSSGPTLEIHYCAYGSSSAKL